MTMTEEMTAPEKGAPWMTVTHKGGVEVFHNEPEIGAYGWRPVDEPEVVAEVMAMWEGKR